MRNWLVTCAALAAFAVPFVAGGASAAAITYTFAGTATGFLGLDPFTDKLFTVTLVGDTDNVTFAGEFFNKATSAAFTIGSSSGTLTGSFNEVILNTDPAAPRVAFGQFTGFDFVAEALQDSSFASYNLKTAFPLTNGAPEFITQVFETSVGSLEFEFGQLCKLPSDGRRPRDVNLGDDGARFRGHWSPCLSEARNARHRLTTRGRYKFKSRLQGRLFLRLAGGFVERAAVGTPPRRRIRKWNMADGS